ncbi:hypothetical protein NA256_20265 [Salmonella sp. NW805]
MRGEAVGIFVIRMVLLIELAIIFFSI